MISYILNGHAYGHEVQTIIQLFYPNEKYGQTEQIDPRGITIVSTLERGFCKSELYQQGHPVQYESLVLEEEDFSADKCIKTKIKYILYTMLIKQTDRKMPWGILTGIRPTKIVHEMWKQNQTAEEIYKTLCNQYAVHPEKAKLAIRVAQTEKEILDQNHQNMVSIYIGIPFCPTRCLYCSFTAYPIHLWKDRVADYLHALEKEMIFVSQYAKELTVQSLYIGGGTPTSLQDEDFAYFMHLVHKYFGDTGFREFTVEAGRPDTITDSKLQSMKHYGVTRISINPQTMNQETLGRIGRDHTVEEIWSAYEKARTWGFDHINMDMILGLPGENVEDVRNTMEKLRSLSPESITVHTMAVKRASRLKENLEQYELSKIAEMEQMLQIANDGALEMGMEPYYLYRQKNMVGNLENVGYCKPWNACIYNIQIMEEKQTILALGAGAITKTVDLSENRIERIVNVKNVEEYIGRIDEMIQRKKKYLPIVHKPIDNMHNNA